MEVAPASLRSLIEPLIDLIHGDLVLEDIGCRRVADAFVAHHEAALRRVVTGHALPDGLSKAIEVYCVRSCLLNAPELLTQSHEVVQMLQRFADTLIEAARASKGEQECERHDTQRVFSEDEEARPPSAQVAEIEAVPAANLLATSGETIKEDVAVLQAKPEAQRCARLIDSLGEVVLGYIMFAAQQCAQQAREYLAGASRHGTHVAHVSYHAALQQFVKSAVEHRGARKRAQEAEAQALLFGNDYAVVVPRASSEDGGDRDEGGPVVMRERDQHGAPPVASESSEADFAAQVQAAMESMPSSPQLLKYPVPQTASTRRGRALHFVNDSVTEQCEALAHMKSPVVLHGQERLHSTLMQPAAPHPRTLTEVEGRASAPAEPTMSPEIVVDPFSLAAASSSLVTSAEEHEPRDDSDNDAARPPQRKLHRADTVFIGASETSVLRMMEHTNDDGSTGHHLLPTPASASASMPSSTLPIGAQGSYSAGGTTGDTVSSASSATVAPVGAVDAREGVRLCLQKQDAEPRAYFLCAATHRFEPCVARGFFCEG
ncbi:hypothetical protein LSCM1_05370 [Leishmania martiniquensis]|uniref:Uncharacterized protein n=1 Tax=Leishmania martiniquensis TaxID=1580590 RepID=A0A836GND8_9TRYP|nr:hypothetical protein LSCM1_05365 [Leishmania martiniquensis]KAG5477032.1 hypothetical protein LSCM1_05370 [Leishmania martiniquensis]